VRTAETLALVLPVRTGPSQRARGHSRNIFFFNRARCSSPTGWALRILVEIA